MSVFTKVVVAMAALSFAQAAPVADADNETSVSNLMERQAQGPAQCSAQGAGSCNYLWRSRTSLGGSVSGGTGTVFDHTCKNIGGGNASPGTAVASQLYYTIDITTAHCAEGSSYVHFDYAGKSYGGNCYNNVQVKGEEVDCSSICAFPCPAH